MFKISCNQNNSQQTQTVKDNPGIFKKWCGGVAGAVIVGLPQPYILKYSGLGLQNIGAKINKSLSKDEVQILNKAGEKIFQDSGLAQKGVSFVRGLTNEDKEIIKIARSLFKGPKAKLKKLSIQQYQLALGRNAFYIPATNTIKFTDKIALSQFHELGHAMNHNGKGFGKFLESLRPEALTNYLVSRYTGVKVKFPAAGAVLALAGGIVGITAILKNKKAKGEKPQGFFDKTTTFIKDNVGKLSFLIALPTALEEGLASFKGERALKGLINKDLFKKVKLQNRIGLLGYIGVAALIGLSTMLVSKIRDKIAQPNLNK